MVCPMHVAAEHPGDTQLLVSHLMCVRQLQSHASTSQEDHGVSQSTPGPPHRHRAHQGLAGEANG